MTNEEKDKLKKIEVDKKKKIVWGEIHRYIDCLGGRL